MVADNNSNLIAMTKEQIIQLIKDEEQRLYAEYLELRDSFGKHEATRYASAQWNAVLTLLEQIENENN